MIHPYRSLIARSQGWQGSHFERAWAGTAHLTGSPSASMRSVTSASIGCLASSSGC